MMEAALARLVGSAESIKLLLLVTRATVLTNFVRLLIVSCPFHLVAIAELQRYRYDRKTPPK
jgi:hypothetical protein